MTRTVPPETVALLRRRYAEGIMLSVLQEETGIVSLWTIYRCLDGHYDDGSGMPLPLPPLPRRRDSKSSQRAALVRRLWRSAEQQVEQIETRMAQSGLAPEAAERDARTLAVLVRTMRELTAFDAAKRAKGKQGDDREQQPKRPHDTPVPRNIDELRRALARKLEALAQEPPETGVGDHPPARDGAV